MTRSWAPIALAASVVVAAVVALGAQEPAPQQPFRTGVDVVRVDVSVLDKNRRPVHGLTAADFTVRENGKPQRIVAVDEVDMRAAETIPSAWMRLVDDNIARNDLSDQVGDGQAVAIVMDDDHIPFDDSQLAVATRNVARYIVDSLAPSDSAAVIFVVRAGNTQDFTMDRSRLLNAIATFDPQEEDRLAEAYEVMASTPYNRVLDLPPCLRTEPLLTTLRAVTERLAAIPNRRKSLLLLSTGSPVQFSSGGGCQSQFYTEMLQTFRLAQRANVNIHGIDPGGLGGMEAVLMRGRIRDGRMVMPSTSFDAHQQVEALHEFLKVYANQTGGRAVVDSVDVDTAIDEIFTEASSYYLVGYETSNPEPDGKFRRLEIKVQGRDLTVVAKRGYWAPDKDSLTAAANRSHDAPDRFDLNRNGLGAPIRLALRALAQPVAVAPDGRTTVETVLGVRVPAPRSTVTDRLAIVRSAINLDGESGPPQQEILTPTIEPTSGDDIWYETRNQFTLEPGRYEIRFEAHSDLADTNGSVYAPIDVPDLRRCSFCTSALVLGTAPEAAPDAQPGTAPDAQQGARPGTTAGAAPAAQSSAPPAASSGGSGDGGAILPIAPTTARDFLKNDRVTAWLRLFQRGEAPPVGVAITAKIVDAAGAEVRAADATVPDSAFAGDRTATYQFDLPLAGLEPGLHLLSVTAARTDGRTIRRDLVFRVR